MIRKTECRHRYSPCGRGYRQEGRLLYRQRLYGHVGVGTPGVARHARRVWLHENLRRRPPDATGPVPSGVPPGQDGQGNGDGHRRRQTTENHRQRVRPVRQHHRGYRLRP